VYVLYLKPSDRRAKRMGEEKKPREGTTKELIKSDLTKTKHHFDSTQKPKSRLSANNRLIIKRLASIHIA
jgi:hypothetical protein